MGVYEHRQEVNKTEEIAAAVIPLGRPMQVCEIIATLARAQRAGGKKDLTLQENRQSQVLSLVALFGCGGGEQGVTQDERAEMLARALAIMNEDRDARAEAAAAKAAAHEERRVAAKAKRNAALKTGSGATAAAALKADDADAVDPNKLKVSRKQDEEDLEMSVQLWARLAREALFHRQLRQAQNCAQYALEALPDSAKGRARVPQKVWRWLSVAECLWARAIANMIVPSSQEKSL